jgi:GNAT superfamily N-acetyltransferase
MKQSVTEERQEYLKDTKQYKNNLEQNFGVKIKSIDFVENNEVFEMLVRALEEFQNFVDEWVELEIVSNQQVFATLVGQKNGYILKFQDTITFFVKNDGSHIRISPYGKDGIEISRVWIHPSNQRKGLGKSLMNLVFGFVEFAEAEPKEYFLECTGAVGTGANHQEVGIDVQTKFFREFGFRVNNGKSYPQYVSMLKRGTSSNI